MKVNSLNGNATIKKKKLTFFNERFLCTEVVFSSCIKTHVFKTATETFPSSQESCDKQPDATAKDDKEADRKQREDDSLFLFFFWFHQRSHSFTQFIKTGVTFQCV